MKFTILGRPQAKQRPRFSRGHTYTPKATKDYETYVRDCYRTSNGLLHYGALKMMVEVYYHQPKGKSLKWATKRPDLDNLVKGIADALNGIAYNDDSQIVELVATKQYGVDDMVVVSLEQKE